MTSLASALDVPACKYGGHRSNGNGDINCYINSYMDTLGKPKINASIGHIERFSKSRIPIYNSEVSATAGRKKKKKEMKKNTGSRKALFHANALNQNYHPYTFSVFARAQLKTFQFIK